MSEGDRGEPEPRLDARSATAEASAPPRSRGRRAAAVAGRSRAPGADGGVPVSEEDEAWVSDRGAPAVNLAILAAANHLVRRPPFADGFAVAQRLLREPATGAATLMRLGGELARIALGRSELAPRSEDRRYADEAWRSNPFLRALAQSHVALANAVAEIIDATAEDEGARYRLTLAANNAFEALSPPNVLPLNPAALKAAVDTGGKSVARGLSRFLEDARTPPRLPVRADPSAYTLGVDVAPTPGAVIARTDLMEIVQYETSTPEVREQPLLIVPSVVNKFYLTDLSPGRSLVAHAIAGGHQTFSIAWVNPDERHRGFGLDSYIASIEEALDVVQSVTGSERPHVLGVCAGGQLATIAAAHLAAAGRPDRIGSLTLLVSILDHESDAMPTGLVPPHIEELALQDVRRRGFVDGRDLTAALAWLRSIDSVWWPWTHRYLMGAEMPKFDLFYWSEDVANVTAQLVVDMSALTTGNRLVKPGSQTVLGEPVDLRQVTVDTYVAAGLTDHLTPWQGCYRTTQLLGGRCRFVLVMGGHIQAIIRPPGGRSAGYRTATKTPPDPEQWLATTTEADGSWWDHWLDWLSRRSPGTRPAPEALGSEAYGPIEPAPGQYVRRRLDGK